MPRSFNGIGTTFYGQSDFDEDGSFITTKWFIIGFFPLIPTESLRVRYAEEQGFFSMGSTSYEVIATLPVHIGQMLRTWMYVCMMIGVCILVMEKPNMHPIVKWTLLIAAAAMPMTLRFFAKRAASAAPAAPQRPVRRERPITPIAPGVKITTCPKCAYVRKPDDYAPEWQCPSCKVAYNKVMPA